MKLFIFVLVLFAPSCLLAKNKFWLTNKTEIGYGKVFLCESVTIEGGTFVKNSFGPGFQIKLSENVKYKTFYLVENSRKNGWVVSHFLGASFGFKFK